MKSLNNILAFSLLCLVFIVTSCGEEEQQFYTGGDNFHFLEMTSTVGEEATTAAAIPVVFTKTTPKTGSVTFSVTSTDAVENVDYVILNTSNVFDYAADQYLDSVFIRPIDNGILDGNKTLTITFTSASEATGWPGPDALNSTHELTILDDDCELPLLGSFTEVTAGGPGDGAGGLNQDINPFPWAPILEVTKVSCDGDGIYSINDITMGLYPDGYGATGGPDNGKNAAVFSVSGSSITIDVVNSQDVVYGGDEFSGSGGVISNDSFTLIWTNNWGDQGSSTLNRL